jgi:hypothetical protein
LLFLLFLFLLFIVACCELGCKFELFGVSLELLLGLKLLHLDAKEARANDCLSFLSVQQRDLGLIVILSSHTKIEESLGEALVGLLAFKTALDHLAAVGGEATIPQKFEGLWNQLIQSLSCVFRVFQNDVLMWVQSLM